MDIETLFLLNKTEEKEKDILPNIGVATKDKF